MSVNFFRLQSHTSAWKFGTGFVKSASGAKVTEWAPIHSPAQKSWLGRSYEE
jgi:hypothetical protein